MPLSLLNFSLRYLCSVSGTRRKHPPVAELPIDATLTVLQKKGRSTFLLPCKWPVSASELNTGQIACETL